MASIQQAMFLGRDLETSIIFHWVLGRQPRPSLHEPCDPKKITTITTAKPTTEKSAGDLKPKFIFLDTG